MRYFFFLLLVLIFQNSYSQTLNNKDALLLSPDLNLGSPIFLVKEVIKTSGLMFTEKTSSDGTLYLNVNTKHYEIAYFYNNEGMTYRIRAFDNISKTKKWQDFYKKQVSKWPESWSKNSEFSFKCKTADKTGSYNVNILRDYETRFLIIDITN